MPDELGLGFCTHDHTRVPSPTFNLQIKSREYKINATRGLHNAKIGNKLKRYLNICSKVVLKKKGRIL